MNGVLHSEHVISRSGIAVSPRKWKQRTFTFLLFGALALRFFQPPGCGAKALFFINARRKAGVPTVSWPECTPAMQSIQFFYANFGGETVAEDLQIQSGCGMYATDDKTFFCKTSHFDRHIGCSITSETWIERLDKDPDIWSNRLRWAVP